MTSEQQFETQREYVPRTDTGELDTALAFLDFVRACVLKKAGGLSEEQLRRPLVPSGTSLLGLVQHLAVGERYWFGYMFGDIGEDEDFDFNMAVLPSVTAPEVIAEYRASVAASNELIRGIAELDTVMVHSTEDDRRLSLRWAVAHMTGETTRHAGHADILRELLDGVTGR